MRDKAKGFLIAAPSSGAGKTTVTLALLRAFRNLGKTVVSAKSGPDYIDPKFHEAASGHPCINLDAWAMDTGTLRQLAATGSGEEALLIVEGAMGLFDGAMNGTGSAADLAAALELPVVLVVDCSKQAQSVAALISGFQNFRNDVEITGVILNRVGSSRHEAMLRRAVKHLGVTVLGAIPRSETLVLPERHLGLVQAGEHPDLERFLQTSAEKLTGYLDLPAVEHVARRIGAPAKSCPKLPTPLGQKIAVARDIAFSFAYPHLLDFWKTQGAEISFFSPLEDEAPDATANAIYLPGGYPELHAGRLSGASKFKRGIASAAAKGALIYGECGGYMTLGKALIDADGQSHPMLDLLPLVTSYQTRKRHLGYRVIETVGNLPWEGPLAAHEFHYASIMSEGEADRLFKAEDADGVPLPPMGLRVGAVMGSFAHVISRYQVASSTTS